jgi:uncharacterized delta-60 repeat protein
LLRPFLLPLPRFRQIEKIFFFVKILLDKGIFILYLIMWKYLNTLITKKLQEVENKQEAIMKTQRDYFVLLAGMLVGATLIVGSAAAQVWEEWVAVYPGGGTSPESIALDSNGNVYVSGGPFLTVKYSPEGQELWEAIYVGPNYANAMTADPAGNVFVTGGGVGTGTFDDYVTVKYNSEGVEQWVARYNGPSNGSEEAMDIALDATGNVYVTGGSWNASSAGDYYTLKYDSTGAEQWAAIYNGSTNYIDRAEAIAVDAAGNVYVTGQSYVTSLNPDYATVKYNSAGMEQWAVRYDGPVNGWDVAYDLAVDWDGNVYVCGLSTGLGTYYDYLTVKYDSTGAEQWAARFYYPGNYLDIAKDIELDANGNVCVTGNAGGIGGLDYATIKYNSEGQEQWVTSFQGNLFDEAFAMALDAEENIYVTGGSGWSYQWYIGENYATVKYNSVGEEQWVKTYNGPANNRDEARSIAVATNGDVCVAGFSYGETYDYATIKYSQICPVNITITPINPPIQIPPSGGSFDFTISLINNASSAQNFDVWIMMQLPEGSWRGPMLGPINLTLPGGGSIERLRTQNIPGRAPAGIYTYRGYVGDYPAKWDSSSFTFEKLGSGTRDSGFGGWTNTGEEFDLAEVGARRASPLQPEEFGVATFPNPFNPKTVLSYQLPVTGHVRLDVYDLSGRLVTELVNDLRDAGVHQVTWDASGMPSGLYFCRIQAGAFTAVVKMMLVK